MPAPQLPHPAPGERHFVFDFGGVLFNWQPHELLRRTLPQQAIDEPSARHWVQQVFENYGGDWGEFDRGTVSPAELVLRIAVRTGLSAAAVQAVVDAVPAELQPQAATVALLGRLRTAGHRLFYLSNMPQPFAEHLERTHPFVGWFEDGVFSSRVQHIKPEPAIFALAARRFGLLPTSLMFIDDVEHNVRAARVAGWNAQHFVDAEQCEAGLREQGWL